MIGEPESVLVDVLDIKDEILFSTTIRACWRQGNLWPLDVVAFRTVNFTHHLRFRYSLPRLEAQFTTDNILEDSVSSGECIRVGIHKPIIAMTENG